jgi:hypothetical protein
MLKLDKRLISEIQEKWIEKIKVFFYDAGCSGSKLDIVFDDFEKEWLEPLPNPPLPGEGTRKSSSWKREVPEGRGGWNYKIYVEKKDREKFENCSITRVQKADHTGRIKTRYMYTSKKVLDRCGCGTSFGFEKKKPKIDLDKLKNLKTNFKQLQWK